MDTTISTRLFSLLKSCNNVKSLRQVQIIHQKIISLGLQNNISFIKNLINQYISCHAHKSADLIFRKLENPLDITLWNGLMASYTKNFMHAEALSLFENLLQFPYLKPDSYTYPSVLKACAALREVYYGEKIHSHLMKTGFLSDVVIASSLISVYAKCSLFGSAVKLFDEMPERDLACWNNVISCYYQSGQWEKALEFFERMRNAGFVPNSVSFTTAISSCGRLLNLERGMGIHEEMLRIGVVLDSFMGAALVDMYGKCGCLEKAKEIFDEINDKSLVCWNALIGGYCQVGDSVSCIGFLAEMNENKIRPTSTTMSSLLLSCARSAQLNHGKFIHGYIIRNPVLSDIFVQSSLIDFYFKCRSIALAERIFGMMPKSNIIGWNVMISGYVSAGCYFEALGLYNEMKQAGARPDAITLTSCLSACSQMCLLERGKEFHQCITDNRLDSNEVVMGALLDMYAKCGAVDEAAGVFDQLITRDLVSWTSMIVAYGSHGRAFEALRCFEEMLEAHVRPDRIAFLAVISACSHAGLVNEGKHYFNLMVNDYGIRPTTTEYSCVIDLLGRAGRLLEAYDILQKNPNMKNDVDLLSPLFAACNLHGELNLGEKIASSLIEKGPEDPSNYVVLEKMYATVKNWEALRKIRLKMREQGLKKNPGRSWIEVDDRIQSFLSNDKTFLKAESVYECLSVIYDQMEKDDVLLQGAF